MPNMNDPMERIVYHALTDASISFVGENGKGAVGLDFCLTDIDVHIEVKQMHSPRISEQMSRAKNVIAIQGIGAAKEFYRMLNSKPYLKEE